VGTARLVVRRARDLNKQADEDQDATPRFIVPRIPAGAPGKRTRAAEPGGASCTAMAPVAGRDRDHTNSANTDPARRLTIEATIQV
jgi:hypothetical protein